MGARTKRAAGKAGPPGTCVAVDVDASGLPSMWTVGVGGHPACGTVHSDTLGVPLGPHAGSPEIGILVPVPVPVLLDANNTSPVL